MKNLSEVKVIATGILVIVVVGAVLASVCSGAVLWGWIPESALRIVGAVVTFAAAMTGGSVVGRRTVGGALPKALIAVVGYLALVFILRGLLFRSVGEGAWLPVLASALGAVSGVLLTVGKGKKCRRR